jgi:glycosyltransferase involved in cell wall biosynthesis
MIQNSNIFELDKTYSTTRRVTKQKPIIENKPEDKVKTQLFLPAKPDRKGEGGLRCQGYFKHNEKDKPLISVITVVFNGEKYLEQTIQSVINQTYDNVEYIIIDGGSTDETLDIIRKYEGMVDYWISEGDEGIYDAMNKGLNVFSGEWVLFLGADDKLFDNDIFKSIFFCHYNADAIFGSIVYDNGKIFKSTIGLKTLFINTVHHQSVFYNSCLFNNFHYDITKYIVSDYELNLRLYLFSKHYIYVNKHISQCSMEGISHSQDGINVYKDMFFIRSGYINNITNSICLVVGLINYLRRKIEMKVKNAVKNHEK